MIVDSIKNNHRYSIYIDKYSVLWMWEANEIIAKRPQLKEKVYDNKIFNTIFSFSCGRFAIILLTTIFYTVDIFDIHMKYIKLFLKYILYINS